MTNLVDFAKFELKLKLTPFQQDILGYLESDPDAWQRILKPKTHDIRLVLDVHRKWQEHMSSVVAC
jgi:hypothetical protein